MLEAFSNEEKQFVEYLVKKYYFGLGT